MKKTPQALLREIAQSMSGVEWDAQVMNRVADLLHENGYEIKEPSPERLAPAACPHCAKRDALQVTEMSMLLYPYDAQRHTADESYERVTDPNPVYGARCAACGMTGTLDAFGMKLLDWTDLMGDEDDEDEDDEEDGDGLH